MPKETWFNLDEEKRSRVYNALFAEFTRVPLEECSIKNIVVAAEIPRGSFYQYFEDKEDALRYLIATTRALGEDDFRTGEAPEGIANVFDFLLHIGQREMDILRHSDQGSPRLRLLNQIGKSSRASTLFNDEIGKTAIKHPYFSNFLINSGMGGLSDENRNIILDLLSSSLRKSLVGVLMKEAEPEEALRRLKMKFSIIQVGVAEFFMKAPGAGEVK